MSIKALNAVWQLPDAIKITPTELNTLLAIADRANDDMICWPGQLSLAKKIRISDRQLRRVLDSLEKQGLLEITHRPGDGTGRKTNVYKLCITSEQMGQPDKMSDWGNRTFEGGQPDIAMSSNTTDKPSVKNRDRQTPEGVNKEAWELWDDHRKRTQRSRSSWTPAAQKIAAKRLRTLSKDLQLICVEESIQNGWQGLFPDRIKIRNGTRVRQSAPKRESAIQACRNPDQLAALCQGAGIGLPPPGMNMEASKVWAMRKLGAPS